MTYEALTYEACMAKAKAQLVEAEKILAREISTYPTPIAGCDQQFNHLLEERRRAAHALEALGETFFTPTPRQLEDVSGGLET